jgi:hypothetical protein
MGLLHSPLLNTNGLVLHLNAYAKRSYPGTGTNWYDLSGNNNHGTLINGPTYSGANGGIISFDGNDDWAQILPSSTFSSISNVTMSGWIITRFQDGSLFPYRFGFSTAEFNDFRFSFYRQNTGNTFFVCAPASGASSTINQTIPIDTWQHITMVADGLTFLLYINGVLVQQTTKLAGLNLNGAGFSIGKQYNRTTAQLGNISVDDMRVYNRALSASEVLQIFNSTRKRFGV